MVQRKRKAVHYVPLALVSVSRAAFWRGFLAGFSGPYLSASWGRPRRWQLDLDEVSADRAWRAVNGYMCKAIESERRRGEEANSG